MKIKFTDIFLTDDSLHNCLKDDNPFKVSRLIKQLNKNKNKKDGKRK